ncbi:hypothetical protein J5N97_022254 [Dioscorea zingiberensis]|uniref:AAA+ ATPase domain-containing protein n=1 Tax=Dioscorea zingiberensis TaxID=325984 RepID=A0A9D5HAN0_9LILI|nr:hypothetical protein J5N97_022254 [Dioscorea zingiberensis]
MENSVVPSELHLKKELITLQKFRFLRDPETYSTWQSPLSSKSVASFSSLSYGKGSRRSPTKSEKIRKNVYLYNWRHHSCKSSDNGSKSGEEKNRQRSFRVGLKDSLHKNQKFDYKSDTCLSDSIPEYSEKSVRKLSSTALRRAKENSNAPKMITHPSTSGGIISRPLNSYASTQNSFYSRYGGKHDTAFGIGRETLAFAEENEVNYMELSPPGCCIGHSWPKRVKERGRSGSYSPSLSNSFSRKDDNVLRRSQWLRGSKRSSISSENKCSSPPLQCLPLLTSSSDRDVFFENTTSDEMRSNFELDLEASSQLDEKKCLSYRNKKERQQGGTKNGILSEKYRPRFFDDIIGQNIVVESLRNSILSGRIAPAYLFHGPRGTGKTSTAKIFAAALNCMFNGKNRPCGLCRECTDFSTGSVSNMREVDGSSKKATQRVMHLLRNMSTAKAFSRYKIVIVNECHMLSPETFSTFMKFLKQPPSRVVIVFTTIDPDSMPQTIVSLCQKYHFSKIKDTDIVSHLKRLSIEENLDVELNALHLIASNSDGSLQNAEMILDQLSLLGRKITALLVNNLFGVVPDEQLIDLLEIAMSSDTAETVKKCRELMDSGADPAVLMSKLAGLIMDNMSGTYQSNNANKFKSENLHHALKILSDAEKQLKLSSEHSTWFTATLLQLGSNLNQQPNRSSIGSKQHSGSIPSEVIKLEDIWRRCIDKCPYMPLKHLLHVHGKLMSITEVEGISTAIIAFKDGNTKSKADRFLSSITNSFSMVLGHTVEVRIGLLHEHHQKAQSSESDMLADLNQPLDKERRPEIGHRESVYYSSDTRQRAKERDEKRLATDEGFPMQNMSILSSEANIEPAFYLKPQNKATLQNGAISQFQRGSSGPKSVSSRLWEEDLIHEIEELKIDDSEVLKRERVRRMVDHYPISPSILHTYNLNTNFDIENK